MPTIAPSACLLVNLVSTFGCGLDSGLPRWVWPLPPPGRPSPHSQPPPPSFCPQCPTSLVSTLCSTPRATRPTQPTKLLHSALAPMVELVPRPRRRLSVVLLPRLRCGWLDPCSRNSTSSHSDRLFTSSICTPIPTCLPSYSPRRRRWTTFLVKLTPRLPRHCPCPRLLFPTRRHQNSSTRSRRWSTSHPHLSFRRARCRQHTSSTSLSGKQGRGRFSRSRQGC